MKLLVRNLAVATTEDKLISLFSEYGKVQSCNLVLDEKTGKSKGFGFIEMPRPGEAKAAVKNLNGFKLAGNIIRVKKAQPKNNEDTEKLEKPAPVQFKQTPKVKTSELDLQQQQSTEKATISPDDIWGEVKQSEE